MKPAPDVHVRRIQLGEGELFRSLRLAALQDAPHAFGTLVATAPLRTANERNERTAESLREVVVFARPVRDIDATKPRTAVASI